MRRRVLPAALVTAIACFGALEASAAVASSWRSDTLSIEALGSVRPAVAVPAGYWVDVDESGTTTSDNLGGSGSLAATGAGNVNYGFARECAPSSDGGPFSSGHYPPATCPELGRAYNSTGSPEQPSGFWFTGNQNCVNAGRPFSGADFTWHVQLPQTGSWHVEAYAPSWTSYGWGNQYILAAGDGRFENYPVIQQAYHGQWVNLFGSHQFNANQDYTVELTLADGSDANCHYQMADQMKWVYDGAPPTTPVTGSAPAKPEEQITLPTVTTTKVEPNREQKSEPPECVAAPQAAGQSRPHLNKRLTTHITQGARRLMHASSVRVKMSITLCSATAREAGVAPGTHLTGAGTIDSSRTRARWTITLPPSLGGNVLSVISHGSDTYLRADSLGLNARKPWIHIRAREFASTRRLGFLGLLAADTNPAAGVGLTTDMAPEATAGPVAHPSRDGTRFPEAARAAGSSCDVAGGATISGPLDLHNDKAIIGRAKAWKDAASTVQSSSKDIRSVIQLNRGGTLTSVTVAVFKGQTAALTVADDLCPESHHDPGQDPVASSVPHLGSVFALDPCLVGSWSLHQAFPGLGGNSPPASGTVSLTITPIGATTLTYLISESEELISPLPPPAVFDGAPYYTNTTTRTWVGDPTTVLGTASGEVLAPLTPNQQRHSLYWGIIASTVTLHLPGVQTVEAGEKGVPIVDGDAVILEETPYRTVTESRTWELPETQLINSSSYECEEKLGVGMLKVELPYHNTEELEFWRAGRKSNG